jgi:hypothetical protein
MSIEIGSVEPAWLSAGEVAQRLLTAELREAGVHVPNYFGAHALKSALDSIRRWTEESRLFAVDGFYPRYQFDDKGRPHPAIQDILRAAGKRDQVELGRWMAKPNIALLAQAPADLLAKSPAKVLDAWRREGEGRGTGAVDTVLRRPRVHGDATRTAVPEPT